MKNLKIGIIGGGVVGQATARSYLEHVAEVQIYDTDPTRSTVGDDVARVVELSDIIFVCLPTPQMPGGIECDLSAVEGFFARFERNEGFRNANYVVRSTVPIGTTRMLRDKYGLTNLVHSPEFLTARCAQVDAQVPSRNIIGVPGWDRQSYSEAHLDLTDLYQARFPSIRVHHLTSDESEAVKLFQNGFFAVKVAYWNEVRSLADKLELDWDRVRNAILADGRIHPSHTQVPGPDGKRGFGGTCLPKDLASLIYQLGPVTSGQVCKAAYERNRYDRERL